MITIQWIQACSLCSNNAYVVHYPTTDGEKNVFTTIHEDSWRSKCSTWADVVFECFWRDCIVPSIFGGAYQTNCQLLVGGPWDFLIHNVQLSFPAKPSNTCCGDFWIRQFLGTFSEADSLAYGCEIYDGSLNTAVINLPYPTNYTPDISSEGTWIRKVKYLKYLKIMATPRPFEVPQLLTFRSTAKLLTFQVPAVWTVPCHGRRIAAAMGSVVENDQMFPGKWYIQIYKYIHLQIDIYVCMYIYIHYNIIPSSYY